MNAKLLLFITKEMLSKQFLYLEVCNAATSEVGQSFVLFCFKVSALTELFLKIIFVPNVREKATETLSGLETRLAKTL